MPATAFAQVLKSKVLKKHLFLAISTQKARAFVNFLLVSAHFRLAHFNTCAFARAKTPFFA
jgi:hypothetical protein